MSLLIDKAKGLLLPYLRYIEGAGVLLILTGTFWLGTELQYLTERTRENATLKAIAAQRNAAEAAEHELAVQLQQEMKKQREKERDLRERMRHEIASNTSAYACPVPDDGVRLLNE